MFGTHSSLLLSCTFPCILKLELNSPPQGEKKINGTGALDRDAPGKRTNWALTGLASQGSLPGGLSAWAPVLLVESVSWKSEVHARPGVATPESGKTKQGNRTDYEVSVGLPPPKLLAASGDALA